jgi:hypothetical protein
MGAHHEAVVRPCLDCLVARHLETALDHYADDATLTRTYFSAFEPSPRGAARSLVETYEVTDDFRESLDGPTSFTT